MMKFSYEYDEDSPKIEMSLRSDSTVGEVLEQFQAFLTASGYHIEGMIEVLSIDDLRKLDQTSIVDTVPTFTNDDESEGC